MFTEQSLREKPSLVKTFMGISAEQFWELLQQMSDNYSTYLQERRTRSQRRRALGAGRHNDFSLVIRTALVLTYLRTHIPQEAVAALFGATQSDVSRELRRLLPLIQRFLPCPVVWQVVEPTQPLTPSDTLPLTELAEGRVLIDATEQRISRPHDLTVQKHYYSGKKGLHTLKTQFVTDGAHIIKAISCAVPGAKHDKALSDHLHTLERLPTGCEAMPIKAIKH